MVGRGLQIRGLHARDRITDGKQVITSWDIRSSFLVLSFPFLTPSFPNAKTLIHVS